MSESNYRNLQQHRIQAFNVLLTENLILSLKALCDSQYLTKAIFYKVVYCNSNINKMQHNSRNAKFLKCSSLLHSSSNIQEPYSCVNVCFFISVKEAGNGNFILLVFQANKIDYFLPIVKLLCF